MMIAALLLALAGATCLFMPAELAASFGADVSVPQLVLIQVSGALYLGLAMANWMAKALPIGGIYGRPVSMANFVHFFVGALALLKHVVSSGFSWPAMSIFLVYLLFAVLFGYMVFFDRPGTRS